MGLCLNKSRYEYLVTKQVQTLYYQDSRINTQYSILKNQESRIKNQESTVHRQGSQAWPNSLASRPPIRDGLSSRTPMGSGLRNTPLSQSFPDYIQSEHQSVHPGSSPPPWSQQRMSLNINGLLYGQSSKYLSF